MPEPDDITLLKQYAGGDEAAFTELFERYVHLVYSTALRQARNPSHAEEVTQAVFILLARKAKSLSPKTVLSGWLYQAARLTTASLIKREVRRQRREQEVYMQTLTETDTSLWEQISPLLDNAMGRLGEKDRSAIVLRFFENRTPQEVAAALKLNEVTARKRVSRALEKLRTFFAKRGVVVTTAIIAGTISGNSVQAAPTALANPATAIAIAKGATVSTSTLTLIKGALKIMAWTKAKTAIVVGVATILAVGTTTVALKRIAANRPQAWQVKYDLSVLGKIPQQVKILPAIPWRQGDVFGDSSHGTMGLGVTIKDIVEEAYGCTLGRMIYPPSIPNGDYDFISNLHQGADKALQQEIKNKFGLIGRRELIETNALVFTVRNRNPAGLKPSSAPANENVSNRNRHSGSYSCHNMPISNLVGFLEDYLGMPVVNQTKLTGRFDIDITGDGTPEGLKRAVLEQLGLELVPTNMPIEMLVVEKAR